MNKLKTKLVKIKIKMNKIRDMEYYIGEVETQGYYFKFKNSTVKKVLKNIIESCIFETKTYTSEELKKRGE